ncbi:hypothetical protein DOZ80_01405 [Pseudomonas fluorescens]|uniref:Bacterial Ig-like domain-containing protein n=2 Tax=Pseudomonas fluorescens TaxID=294 RepID=A0A327NAG7_PSEFL|nr:hypothetical protein DOZ80_01405 [Pseudomonas fluorescens]
MLANVAVLGWAEEHSRMADESQQRRIDIGAMESTGLTMFDHQGDPIPGEFAGNGTVRLYTPSGDWLEGENTVTVVQTVNAVDSEASEPCTFIILEPEGEKPDAPHIALPLAGTRTTTRPQIQVLGLPHALITVCLKGSDTELCSQPADENGELLFRVENPLVPGRHELEAQQKGNGPASGWNPFPHSFTVKEIPKTPTISSPRGGENMSRYPVIRGTATETRGLVILRHDKDPEDEGFAAVQGVRSWRWPREGSTAEPWDVGQYSIVARHSEEFDDSPWTDVRTFNVVESLYGFGDAGPVLGQPVVDSGQSTLLRVQVTSGETGEPVDAVGVQWRIQGESQALQTTLTGPDGWTAFRYRPDSAGGHEVLAEITEANQGVVMTQLFEVTALAQDDWAREAELYLNGERVDLAKGDIVLIRQRPYELELKVNSGSRLIGSSVTLQDLWGVTELDLGLDPEMGVPQLIEEGQAVRWSIFSGVGEAGYFGLKLTSPVMVDWHLPGEVKLDKFLVDLLVKFDTLNAAFDGGTLYPCIGIAHNLAIHLRNYKDSELLGKPLVLEVSDAATGLNVTVSPDPSEPQIIGPDGVKWAINCVEGIKGDFSVRLKVPESGCSSMEIPMSVGHNRVTIADYFGPVHNDVPGDYWKYGVRTRSYFTRKMVGGVEVIVDWEGTTQKLYTEEDGWLYVQYSDMPHPNFIIYNRYDGSIAE